MHRVSTPCFANAVPRPANKSRNCMMLWAIIRAASLPPPASYLMCQRVSVSGVPTSYHLAILFDSWLVEQPRCRCLSLKVLLPSSVEKYEHFSICQTEIWRRWGKEGRDYEVRGLVSSLGRCYSGDDHGNCQCECSRYE